MRAIIFSKLCISFFLLFIISFFVIIFDPAYLDLSLKFIDVPFSLSPFYSFGFSSDWIFWLFISIVRLVTFIVIVYRQVYIEHYNNKKFLILLFIFFLSMFILVFRDTFLVLIIGWDGLGISSIFLIIFYPNKITLYNSLLTIFFNRLGDVTLILVISHLITNYYFFIPLSNVESLLILILILLCRFAKRAQFPLSSWLPAAMSAPTPISAMVHSSTLVTAGLYLTYKASESLWANSYSCNFWIFFSLLTFILGGFLSNLELDFKKMVAFSTISQIRIIIVTCSLTLIVLSSLHIIFHAFFKTLLFCSSGIIFIFYYREQKNFLIKLINNSKIGSFLFFSSVFSITGLIFSSSFFSKDLAIEILCTYNSSAFYLFFFLGRVLTLIYRSKILTKCIHSLTIFSNFYSKKFYSIHFIMFLLVMLYSGYFFKSFFFLSFQPIISQGDLLIISLLFLYFFVNLFKSKLIFFYYYTQDISFIKFFSYSLMSRPLNLEALHKLSFNDEFFIKKSNVFSEYSFLKGAAFTIFGAFLILLLFKI